MRRRCRADLPQVSENTDDLRRDLDDPAQGHGLADGLLAGPEPAGGGSVEDHYRMALARDLPGSEVAPVEHGDAQSGEVAWADAVQVDGPIQGIVGPELQAALEISSFPEGKTDDHRGRTDPRPLVERGQESGEEAAGPRGLFGG